MTGSYSLSILSIAVCTYQPNLLTYSPPFTFGNHKSQSLFLFYKEVHLYHFLKILHKSDIIHYFSFSV